MTDQRIGENQIITLFPSNKTGVSFRDGLGMDDPKIHVVLYPTASGSGGRVEFWMNAHDARLLFMAGRSGQLPDLVASNNRAGKPENGFDLYAKAGDGFRTLTIKRNDNGHGGVWLSVVNKSGDGQAKQSVYLSAYTWAKICVAISDYLADYGARKLARRYDPPGDPNDSGGGGQRIATGVSESETPAPASADQPITPPSGGADNPPPAAQQSRVIAPKNKDDYTGYYIAAQAAGLDIKTAAVRLREHDNDCLAAFATITGRG